MSICFAVCYGDDADDGDVIVINGCDGDDSNDGSDGDHTRVSSQPCLPGLYLQRAPPEKHVVALSRFDLRDVGDVHRVSASVVCACGRLW